jgi:hypothetical protein
MKILQTFTKNRKYIFNKNIFTNIHNINLNKSFAIKNNIETKINDKFLREDENLSSLLDHLQIGPKTNYTFLQKDEALFINSQNTLLENIKLGDLISINDKYIAQCHAIKENLVTFVLIDKK